MERRDFSASRAAAAGPGRGADSRAAQSGAKPGPRGAGAAPALQDRHRDLRAGRHCAQEGDKFAYRRIGKDLPCSGQPERVGRMLEMA